jgi:hypothetical protein
MQCYPEIIEAIKSSIQTAEMYESDESYIIVKNKSYTLKELVHEMEQNTEFGLELQESIFKLTIDLLTRGKEEL